MKAIKFLACAAIFCGASSLNAQVFTIRGDVDGVQRTQGLFVLDGTNIPLVSSTQNLQFLHDQTRQSDFAYEMTVENIGTPGAPVFDLQAATLVPELMDMGNLRFGRSESWEVFAAPGSEVFVFLNLRSQTSFAPVTIDQSWFLGSNALPIRTGFANGLGSLRFNFTMPTRPALLGVEFSSQAAIVNGGVLSLTELDTKEVRN